MKVSRDWFWFAIALAIAVNWHLHWRSWHSRYDELLKEHASMLQDRQVTSKSNVASLEEGESEIADVKRRYEEEVLKNAYRKATLDARVKWAVDQHLMQEADFKDTKRKKTEAGINNPPDRDKKGVD
ncbi:MAG TPA: hypothetical protein VGI40_14475 [Pirellulaceae bacterium]|jgi:hypothetical protein